MEAKKRDAITGGEEEKIMTLFIAEKEAEVELEVEEAKAEAIKLNTEVTRTF